MNTAFRESIDLTGLWRFQPDPAWEEEQKAYFSPQYEDRYWREVRLPSSLDACHPDLASYEGAAWFRRTVDVPPAWQGKRILLRFHGVNYHARVWVNGHEVGEHRDGFLPFEFPIQEFVRFGEQNGIAVLVDNQRLPGEVPGLQRGWRTYGGILREIELAATGLLYLDHVTVVAEPAAEGGRLALRARVHNEAASQAQARLVVRVLDAAGQAMASLVSQPLALDGGQEVECELQGTVPGAQPWSPAQPTLYTAEVELSADGVPVDAQAIRLGFRQVEARDGGLWLNGERLFLTGFNRHEDSPERDMATDLVTARWDLIQMREAGANFVRLCHYPHHPGELDLCDELGLLAMGEIPLYWWDGYQEGQEHAAQKLAAAKRQLEAMIRRDANHPALIFWSVSNENHEQHPEVVEGNRELITLARALDPTRLAVHVSDHWQQDPHFDPDDVICVNSYPSLFSGAPDRQHGRDLAALTRFWRERLQALHDRYPTKPILITEFGYPAWKDVYGNALGEDIQARVIEAEFAGMDAPYVCGATIWCWADHPWPPATFEFCRYLAISPFGVLTRDRRRIGGYWAARKMFRQKQRVVESPRPTPPVLGMAGYAVDMIRPHLRDIPQVSFPEGFSIRPMRPDEGALWVDIERDAEPYFPIEDNLFDREFGHDLQAVRWRCFFIVDQRGVGVGTISAWYDRNYKGQDYGRIHWVATRQAYQGKGLGKAGLSFALNQLARWHERATLGTQTYRLPAIRLYLDMGFLPDLDAPGAVVAWRSVQERLKHPALDRALS